MIFIFLIFIPFVQSSSTFQYKRVYLETNEWTNYISDYIDSEFIETKIECGSLCSTMEDSCDFFVYDQGCFAGHLQNTEAHSETKDLSGTHSAYVDLTKMKNDFQSYLALTFVKDNTVWGKTVYKSEEMLEPMNILDCSLHCLHIEKSNGCEFFAYEVNICYFGKSSHEDGSTDDLLSNATIYISPAGVENLLDNHGTKNDVLANLWKPHFKQSRSQVDTEAECSLLAQFENWHFSAYDNQICYFGVLETDQPSEAELEENLRLNFNLNLLSPFKEDKFYERSSNKHKPFIYALFQDTKNVEHCSMHCYFDPNGNCDFHFLHNNNCYLGNFNTQEPINSVDGTFTTYIFKENVHDSESKLFPAKTNVQIKQSSSHIKETIEVQSEEECQAHALLYKDAAIDFYAYKDSECYICDLSHSQGSEDNEELIEIKIRTTNALEYINGAFNVQFDLPGSIWNKHIFESQEVFDVSECGVMCELHSTKCDFFTYQSPTCYFGLYEEVNGEIIELDDTLKTYHKSSLVDAYINPKYWSWNHNSNRWQQYAYKSEASAHIRGCSFLCGSDTECEFYVYLSNVCWFGKMDYEGNLLTTATNNLEVFFKVGAEDSGFINDAYTDRNGEYESSLGLMSSTYWQAAIYWKGQDGDGLDSRCAKRCALSNDNTCNFYIVINDHCQLGRFNVNANTFKGPMKDDDVFKLKAHIDLPKFIKDNLGGSNRDCPNTGYHEFTTHAEWIKVESEGYKGYQVNTNCRWAFYAPGAEKLRVRIQGFKTSGSGDQLRVTAGANTGGYPLLSLYGNQPAKTYDFNTEFIHLHWYSNGNSNSDGFTGYVQRLQ